MDRNHRRDGRYEMPVRDVRAFPSPGSEGDWPCISCGETFAVSGSWRIRLEGAGAVVSCGRCADHARRNGRILVPADTTIPLDTTRLTGQRSDPSRGVQPDDGQT